MDIEPAVRALQSGDRFALELRDRVLALHVRLRRNNIDPAAFSSTPIEFEMTVTECGNVLTGLRALRSDAIDALIWRLKDYMHRKQPSKRPVCNVEHARYRDAAYLETGRLHPPLWVLSAAPRPVYLLGRYRKLARDVPQSPWSFGTGTTGSKNGFSAVSTGVEAQELDVEEIGKRKRYDDSDAFDAGIITSSTGDILENRKGRNSVEELIGEAVKSVLGATSCRMHACGREDIDVRCLGNGRPFCLEVSGVVSIPTEARLQVAIEHIFNRKGMNRDGDIDLLLLKEADRALWEGMQKSAEEKDKAYCCVVWSHRALTQKDMELLRQACRSGPSVSLMEDQFGDGKVAVLEIQQKTPLRVVHRRSLLTRTRHISHVETALLGPHYFLLRLQTSAGTYVKEWVHGDLGRTTPSVSAMLGSQTDILQLDVAWLFDEYEGGGKMTSSADRDKQSAAEQKKRGHAYLPWSCLSNFTIPVPSPSVRAVGPAPAEWERARGQGQEQQAAGMGISLSLNGRTLADDVNDKENRR